MNNYFLPSKVFGRNIPKLVDEAFLHRGQKITLLIT